MPVKEQHKATTHTNSELTAGDITVITSGDANVAGGNLHGDNSLSMTVGGDLHLASVQNRYSGSSKGMGISAGMGFEGVFTNENGAKAGSNEVKTTALVYRTVTPRIKINRTVTPRIIQ